MKQTLSTHTSVRVPGLRVTSGQSFQVGLETQPHRIRVGKQAAITDLNDALLQLSQLALCDLAPAPTSI